MDTLDIVWDMEIGRDPDDFFTLILLCGHPKVNLKAVTVVPGSSEQIGVVRQVLSWFECNIPVGAYNISHKGLSVPEWYYDVYGSFSPSSDAALAYEVLIDLCDKNTTLLTGGPLKNLRAAIMHSSDKRRGFTVGRLVAQGGFAGKGLVPYEKQLDKFKGMETAPSHNLGTDPKSALAVLEYPEIKAKYFVSKNVCHGVYYDQAMHKLFSKLKERSLSLFLIWKGMDSYLQIEPTGKKFHDPLAACCAIDETVGVWTEVEIFRMAGQWGARPCSGTKTWITVDYRHKEFIEILTASAI